MNIVVLNTGSGSQRCSLFKIEGSPKFGAVSDPIWEAKVDSTAPGQGKAGLKISVQRGNKKPQVEGRLKRTAHRDVRTQHLLERLWSEKNSPLSGPNDVAIVAHRVVHGADRFQRAVRIDSKVEAAIRELQAFAPLHNQANLAGVRVAKRVFGSKTPQMAVFDTAFHQTLSSAARTYAGPYEWLDRGIRRYGFHGTNFRSVAERTAHLLGRKAHSKLVICHLGGGCSLCAVENGRSIDTTMGFTPLDGVAMCTRSGGIDPGILIYLQREGLSAKALETLLNKESGLKGLSGTSGDTRELLSLVKRRQPRAVLAWQVFIHRIRSEVGAMIASLGAQPDALVFTDSIGESVARARAEICAPFSFLGLEIDPNKNLDDAREGDIATKKSAVRVLIIKSREAWQIARECWELRSERPTKMK